MSDWALKKAENVIQALYDEGRLSNRDAEDLETAIAQALREARAEGVTEIRAAFKNGDIAPITARGAEIESMVSGENSTGT